jgi:branched-chain amino acid transport system substrate-binding protein
MTRKMFSVISIAFLTLAAMQGFAADAVKIGAIFAVTGPNANLGTPEARTLQMLVDEANAAGGIAGRKIELILKDSQGNTEKAVSYAKQLTEENEVLAIIGPTTTGESMALKGYAEQNEQILISCAAGETIVNPVAKWVFKVAPMDSWAAQMIYTTMKTMGVSRIGVLSSNSGFGQGGKAQLEKLAPSNGITIAISEVYDKEATDLTSVLAKIKAQDVQAIVNWSTEPAQSIVLKNIKQLGFTVPVFQSHGFGNIAYATAAGKAAEGTLFPCGRILVADVLPAGHAQKKVLVSYRDAYMAKFKEEPSTFGGHAYDSFQLITEAVRKVGTDKYKVRDYLEGVRGLVGTAGVFNFSPTDHNGLTIDAFEMLTVRNGQFTLMKQ